MKEHKIVEFRKPIPEDYLRIWGYDENKYWEKQLNEFTKQGWKILSINNITDRDGGGPTGYVVFLEKEQN